MILQLGNIGSHLGARVHGAEVRASIIEALKTGEEKIVFDLSNVKSISNSFADECFAKLVMFFPFEEVKAKTTFINAAPFIRSVIADAFKARLWQTV
ncbi:MAG TPA: STAS-like domain-containing protein [Niabella sp.]|jgi:hypothetical protein|nr:STAS-like domain-containing protein [Niabella sp.]HQX21425.1 STAS-like domain-containing protein [Niabella sp.]HQX73458.1 STAS-like domain-containing protein [Chitinophagaceae bacterium]HRB36133.1 STAS-like domain-containing protein [Niabella sp.]HRB79614.1 STAS-like domain-containing protein [Niabella sp.]